MTSGPIQDWSFWYNEYLTEGAKLFDANKQLDQANKTIAKQNEEIERLRSVLKPSVVYDALRHYYKQGLFEPNEYDDLERALIAAGEST